MSNYTPTTDDILRCYMQRGGSEEEFNRWLATVEAAAEQRGRIAGLREAARLAEGQDCFDPEQGLANYIAAELDHLADQMEGDVANQGDWCHAEHCPYRGTGKMPTHRRHEHCPVWRTNA